MIRAERHRQATVGGEPGPSYPCANIWRETPQMPDEPLE
jgi:hypothetical protein